MQYLSLIANNDTAISLFVNIIKNTVHLIDSTFEEVLESYKRRGYIKPPYSSLTHQHPHPHVENTLPPAPLPRAVPRRIRPAKPGVCLPTGASGSGGGVGQSAGLHRSEGPGCHGAAGRRLRANLVGSPDGVHIKVGLPGGVVLQFGGLSPV